LQACSSTYFLLISHFAFRDPQFAISSVIDSVDLPDAFGFMCANQVAILQLHVPLRARPRFFVPPISGKQKWTGLIGDFAGNVAALKMSILRSKNRCRRSRSKSSKRD